MSDVPSELIGTWRLVEWEDRDSEDEPWEETLGPGATGLATFGAGGTVSVQVAAPQTADPDLPPYIGYFGTFTITGLERDGSASRGDLHFALEAAHPPSLLGDDEPRPFEVDGDTLVLGDQRTWRRRCVRA